MSALYQMNYHGVAGEGHGAVYIGRGKVVGVDITGAKYPGEYCSDQVGNLTGDVVLVSAGAQLVTGLQVPPGSKIDIKLALPSDFDSGKYVTVRVAGQPVGVAFQKIGNVP